MKELEMTDIKFSFIPMGSVAGTKEYPVKKNLIYLDVGNDIRTGVLDHHQTQTENKYECAAQIIVDKPNLIFGSCNFNPDTTESVEIVLHEDPDFDCCASAYLASEVIKGKPPTGASLLAKYTADVDAGRKTLNVKQYLTPYAAVLFLNYHLKNSTESTATDKLIVEETVKLMKKLTESMASGIDPDSTESLDWSKQPLLEIKNYINEDREKYLRDINDRGRKKKVEIMKFPVFRKDMSGTEEIDGLFINDPESIMFKYWARGDSINSPDEKGFALTIVTYSDSRRTVIATDPNKPYFLPFLGQVLEIEEVTARRKLHGKDSRLFDDEGYRRKNRYHFNPDPWYDGRGHDYTIVDSPNSGSVLSGEKIREIVAGLYKKLLM